MRLQGEGRAELEKRKGRNKSLRQFSSHKFIIIKMSCSVHVIFTYEDNPTRCIFFCFFLFFGWLCQVLVSALRIFLAATGFSLVVLVRCRAGALEFAVLEFAALKVSSEFAALKVWSLQLSRSPVRHPGSSWRT